MYDQCDRYEDIFTEQEPTESEIELEKVQKYTSNHLESLIHFIKNKDTSGVYSCLEDLCYLFGVDDSEIKINPLKF